MSCPPGRRRTRTISDSSLRQQRPRTSSRSSGGSSRRRRSCTPCCSEGVVCCDERLICCDDADCGAVAARPFQGHSEESASSSIESCSSTTATTAGHGTPSSDKKSLASALAEQRDPDCAECQAASEPCTADCFDQLGVADDCPECKASPATSSRSLPAVNAADVLLDPLECTVPGCDLLEWDDNAIDELLRCCCGTGEHQHIFTTPQSGFVPANSPAVTPPAQVTEASTSNSVHQLSDPLPSTNGVRTPRSFAAPLSLSLDKSAQVGQSLPQIPHTQHEFVQQCTPSCDTTSCVSHDGSDTNHRSADLANAIAPIYSPAHLLHAHAHFHAHQHAHSNLRPLIGDASQVMSQPSPSGSAFQTNTSSPQYRCQWAACSDCFFTREELVGHVNVTHLITLQSLAQGNLYNDFSSHQQFIPANRGTTMSGDLTGAQPAEMDPMLLKCMWDSCDSSLPIAPMVSTPQLMHGPTFPDLTNSNASIQPWNMQSMPGSIEQGNSLGCATTSQPPPNLVKHLLQEHLHIPLPLTTAFPSTSVTQLSPVGVGPRTAVTDFRPSASHSPHIDSAFHSHRHHSHRDLHQSRSRRSTMSISSASSHNANVRTPNDTPVLGASQTLASMGSVAKEDEFGFLSDAALDHHMPSLPNLSYASNAASASEGGTEITAHTCEWETCGMQFPTTAALMDHIGLDHIGSGKSHYLCRWAGCERAQEGRGFNQRQKIVRHVRTHVGDKPCVCEICGRGFSESTTLSQHMRTHTQIKPFECPECGKGFALASALTIHIRTHTGDKPFKCSYPGCDMAFAESSNLSKHLKTHGPAAVREHSLHKKRLNTFDGNDRFQKCLRT